ncbi:phosphotransferase family protein [soil metagenome]
MSVPVPPGIDAEPVSRWLTEHIERAVPPFRFDPIVGGRSNLTYAVTGGDGTCFVLRRPPLGSVLATAHDMAREHRIIAAVYPTGVPVPQPLGLCTDADVNGAPFYVMSYVDGQVLDTPESVSGIPHAGRRAVAEDLIDVLADLHAVDVDACGLGDLAKRDGYVERQLRRWSKQWEASKTREVPAVDEVAVRLAESIPVQQAVTIAHGDYRFGNCIVDVEAGRIAAVLDWELCTLGDPLADVGYLGVYWADSADRRSRPNDPSREPGFPTYGELVQRYATLSGRDVSDVDYYIAFSAFRLAVISEGVFARYKAGVMGDGPDPMVVELFETSTVELAESALAAVRVWSEHP